MVSFNRFIGWCLVGAVGLTSSQFSFAATVTTTKPAANVSCLDAASAAITAGATDAKCIFKDLAPRLTPSPPIYGGYFCILRKENTTNPNPANHSISVGYCNGGSSSTTICVGSGDNGLQICRNSYNSWVPTQTSVAQVMGFDNFAAHLWSTNVDPCQNSQDILNSGYRAPTPNGTGSVCHNGCVYDVSVGYTGTWPIGSVFFDMSAAKRQCNGEPTATNAPIPPEALSLIHI